jgi:hypothetical protein
MAYGGFKKLGKNKRIDAFINKMPPHTEGYRLGWRAENRHIIRPLHFEMCSFSNRRKIKLEDDPMR